MGWTAPALTVTSVEVSPRDAQKNVTLTLGGGGLEGDPAGYAVYLVKPHADATAVLRAFMAEPKPPAGPGTHHVFEGKNVKKVVVVGREVGSPAQNTLVCTMPNPPAGEYCLAVTQVANSVLSAQLYPKEVKIPG